MNLSKLWEILKNREAWRAAAVYIVRVGKDLATEQQSIIRSNIHLLVRPLQRALPVIKKNKKISSWTSSSKRVVGGKYHVISHGNPGKAENHTSKIAEIEEAPRSYSWFPSFLHLPVSLFLS